VVLLNDAWLDRPAPAPEPPEGTCWYCAASAAPIRRRGNVVAIPHPEPAMGVEGDPRPIVLAGAARRQAVGAHELVFGPHDGETAPLLAMIAERWADLRRDVRLRGFGAVRRQALGRHAAWQVFALPYERTESAPAGWRDAERLHKERVIEDDAATTLLAWAPRVPFETWVLPSFGTSRLERSDPAVVDAVGSAVDRALARVSRAVAGSPVDLCVVDGEPWRIELLPRLAGPSAVEAATGVPMHGVLPEAAAEHLRAEGAGSVGRQSQSSPNSSAADFSSTRG
jgi:hypothetical protein